MAKKIEITLIKKLREETGAPVIEIKKALEKSDGDYNKACRELEKWRLEKADQKKGEETSQGVVEAYIHQNRIGVLVVLCCQTDFVAKTAEFRKLAHEIALQIASMNPRNEKELLGQAYIRDPQKTIGGLINESIARLGENISVGKFVRLAV